MAASADEADRRWAELMRAAQDGDGAAYDCLLREIVPFLRAIVTRRCGARVELEEVVQETLLTLHRVRHTYDPSRAFRPWAAAIAERRGLDNLRRRSRVARHEVDDQGGAYETFPDPSANREQDALGTEREVRALVDRLPARQREAIIATHLKGMSVLEASADSGQSAGAIKVNTHRALRALRRMLTKEPDED